MALGANMMDSFNIGRQIGSANSPVGGVGERIKSIMDKAANVGLVQRQKAPTPKTGVDAITDAFTQKGIEQLAAGEEVNPLFEGLARGALKMQSPFEKMEEERTRQQYGEEDIVRQNLENIKPLLTMGQSISYLMDQEVPEEQIKLSRDETIDAIAEGVEDQSLRQAIVQLKGMPIDADNNQMIQQIAQLLAVDNPSQARTIAQVMSDKFFEEGGGLGLGF